MRGIAEFSVFLFFSILRILLFPIIFCIILFI